MSIIRAPYSPNRFKGALDPLLVDYLIDTYFLEGQRVLDPMAGGRMVEKEAQKRDVYCVSNDLYSEGGWDATRPWPHGDEEFDGVIMHPPYFKVKKYGDSDRDLGNITDYWTYVSTIKDTLKEAKRVTKEDGTVILIIGDRRDHGRMRLIHSDVYFLATQDLKLSLEDYVLWELSATGTPLLGTKHMMMFNWALVFKKMEATPPDLSPTGSREPTPHV